MPGGIWRKMSDSIQDITLGEAANRFLAGLSAEERGQIQSEVYKFVRWYGWGRLLSSLSAPEIANYAERLSLSDTEYMKKLELVRAFLAYTKKEGLSQNSLATHLKAKKGKTKLQSIPKQGWRESTSLTQKGYSKLAADIEVLKNRRSQAIKEMSKAAADKDFRENAPLQAAKEERDHLEGRIRGLEEILKAAVIIKEKEEGEPTPRVNLGDRIVLRDLASGEELHYMIVGAREVDPAKGKISNVSPIGKAVIGQAQGKVVEVVVPAGKLRYQIDKIEH